MKYFKRVKPFRSVFCLILMALISVLISGLCFAQTTPAPAPPAAATTVPASATTPDLQVLTSGLPINLTGDTLYRIRGGTIDGAIGMDLAIYKGLVTLRAEISQTTTGSPFAGAGLMVNIPTLVNKISGANWTATFINPSIGIVPGYDFGTKQFDAGVVLSIINIKF